MSQPSTLKFIPPSTFFDPSFWEELYDVKLKRHKLATNTENLNVLQTCSNGRDPWYYSLSKASFSRSTNTSNESSLVNVNTIEEFRDADKKKIIDEVGKKLLSRFLSGSFDGIRDINHLVLLTFADLKSYKFTYWFAAPVLVPDSAFSGVVQHTLTQSWLAVVYRGLLSGFEMFCLMDSKNGMQSCSFAEAWERRYDANVFFVVPDSSHTDDCLGWCLRNFLAFLALHNVDGSSVSTTADATSSKTVNLLCLRGALLQKLIRSVVHERFTCHSFRAKQTRDEAILAGFRDLSDHELVQSDCSVVASVQIPPATVAFRSLIDSAGGFLSKQPSVAGSFTGYSLVLHGSDASAPVDMGNVSVRVVGWESNDRGKPGPRLADLSSVLDSQYLMRQAVDLNLQLMRWRMWPSLDTAKIANTRCLLLGAGTLGCAVGRSLLGWGVRNITFVDNGRVSYSNPARQCLFVYEDCVNREFKATCAANHLRRIFPDVNGVGVVLSIPMPGHPMNGNASEGGPGPLSDQQAYDRLLQLMAVHDVIFALTDSREARWLPTVLAAQQDKLLINIALGFDSYVVMRHGCGVGNPSAHEGRLGCYFCNDIVAATNSTKDRTLDQQCTVTRPGLSFIAAAQGVELMVDLLLSPLGACHPAGKVGKAALDEEDGMEESPVSPIPHQIRGNLSGYTQLSLQSPAFQHCTACSPPIVAAHAAEGIGFVKACCADPSVMERVSGVDQLMKEVDLDACVDSDEDF